MQLIKIFIFRAWEEKSSENFIQRLLFKDMY